MSNEGTPIFGPPISIPPSILFPGISSEGAPILGPLLSIPPPTPKLIIL